VGATSGAPRGYVARWPLSTVGPLGGEIVTEDSPGDITPPVPPRYIAVVRPGHSEIYEFLRHFEAANFTELVWDRRIGERRDPSGTATPDRRAGERRTIPPPTWDALGFVLTPRGAADAGEAPDGRSAPPGQPNLCVVRQGHTDVFELLRDHFQEDPSVQVIWDRRQRDRRVRSEAVSLNRRRADRRLAR